MSAFVIAAFAGCNLVLNPAWTPLDAGYEVLSCRWNMTIVERSTAPDARRPISLDDERHALSSIELSTSVLRIGSSSCCHVIRMVQWLAGSHLLLPEIFTLAICERR